MRRPGNIPPGSTHCRAPAESLWTCFALVLVTLLLLSLPTVSHASLYACRQSDGSISFTNAPATAGCTPYQQKGHHLSPPSPEPDWYTPNFATYDQVIHQAADRYRIDPRLIKAMIRIESGFDRKAISSRGARGLMQLMPGTCQDLQVDDPFDPWQNIDGGTRYLRYLLDTFDGDLLLSLAAYNAGPGAVKRAGGVPRIPETIRYVVKVLKCYRSYRTQDRSLTGT